MKITMFIHDPVVRHWRLTDQHKAVLELAMPDSQVIRVENEEDFLKNLPDSEVIFVWFFKAEWLEKAQKLQWIATSAAGSDHLPVNLPASIKVTRGHFHGKIMAETALSMLLTLCRNTDGWEREGRDKVWPQAEISDSMRILRGAHVVLCGFGPIGQAVAELLKVFDVRLSIIKQTPATSAPDFFGKEDQLYTEQEADAANCWQDADFVVSILPGGEATTNFISQKRINRLPKGAGIINLGRGNAIDEEALIEAVTSGHLRGAFLDVFKDEPLSKNSPLRTTPNIRLMPHISAAAPEYLDYFIKEVCDNV